MDTSRKQGVQREIISTDGEDGGIGPRTEGPQERKRRRQADGRIDDDEIGGVDLERREDLPGREGECGDEPLPLKRLGRQGCLAWIPLTDESPSRGATVDGPEDSGHRTPYRSGNLGHHQPLELPCPPLCLLCTQLFHRTGPESGRPRQSAASLRGAVRGGRFRTPCLSGAQPGRSLDTSSSAMGGGAAPSRDQVAGASASYVSIFTSAGWWHPLRAWRTRVCLDHLSATAGTY